MVRRARVVVPDVAHHITQRGNNRQNVFFTDDDFRKYLSVLTEQCEWYGLCMHGYCLMTNHIHLIAVPRAEDSLAMAIGRTHRRYTQYINQMHGRSGHLWQNRFFSCALDDHHYLEAMRYIERNPVNAGLVRQAWRWPWSSAAAHCGVEKPPLRVIDAGAWQHLHISTEEWKAELIQDDDEAIITAIRNATGTGRPLGSDSFLSKLETTMGRQLRPHPHGRPGKDTSNIGSHTLE